MFAHRYGNVALSRVRTSDNPAEHRKRCAFCNGPISDDKTEQAEYCSKQCCNRASWQRRTRTVEEIAPLFERELGRRVRT